MFVGSLPDIIKHLEVTVVVIWLNLAIDLT